MYSCLVARKVQWASELVVSGPNVVTVNSEVLLETWKSVPVFRKKGCDTTAIRERMDTGNVRQEACMKTS